MTLLLLQALTTVLLPYLSFGQVLGSNYKSELLAVIPPENLPVQFGGSSPCSELTDVGPWQDPAVIASCPALRKAAAWRGLVPSSSCSSLQRESSSLICAGSDGSEDVCVEGSEDSSTQAASSFTEPVVACA